MTRRRTFPLVLRSIVSPSVFPNDTVFGLKESSPILSVVNPVLSVLKYLYSGTRSSICNLLSPSSASYRAVSSVVERTVNLPLGINTLTCVQSLNSKPDRIATLLLGSSYVFLQPVPFKAHWNGLPDRMNAESEDSSGSF